MKGWKIAPGIIVLLVSLFLIGPAMAQEDIPDGEDEDPFGGLFDPAGSELEVLLEWESLDVAKLKMSMEMKLGTFGALFKAFLDTNSDGKIDEDEIGELGNLFEDDGEQDEFLGMEILVDNLTAQTEVEAGWTGLIGDVDSDEPIGMYAITTYTWDIDDSLDRHTITLRPSETEFEEPEIGNWTDDDDEEWPDEDDDELPFNMTFVIKFPGSWDIDLESVEPQMMKQFITEDNTIELTPEDLETIGDPEGDIVSFTFVKGSEDSPLPLWLPVGALLLGTLSVGLLRRRRH